MSKGHGSPLSRRYVAGVLLEPWLSRPRLSPFSPTVGLAELGGRELKPKSRSALKLVAGGVLNLRPSGYEPDENRQGSRVRCGFRRFLKLVGELQ